MTKDEALNLALEALHGFIPYLPLNDEAQCGRYDKAITAIKEALAQPEHEWVRGECVKCGQSMEQPEQEPVVWMYQDKSTHEVRFQKHMRDFVDHGQTYETPLYTTPPQRTWVGLTDEEISELIRATHNTGSFVRAIEAKLKEKNNG